MINYLKMSLLSILLIASLTACNAENPQINDSRDLESVEQLNDSIQVAVPKAGEWITDYDQAIKLAKETDKNILVNFTGSDWCIWCKRLMKEVFTEKAFIDYASTNLILLKLDFPKAIPQTAEEKMHNETLARQFSIQGFPTIIILDKDGKEIARTGYQEGGPEKYVDHLKSIIK